MSSKRWTCFVCGKPVSDDTVHFAHAENCGFKETGSCDCDYPCHPRCCPDCNPIDKQGYKAARGALPWQPGDEPAVDAIRRLRGGSS